VLEGLFRWIRRRHNRRPGHDDAPDDAPLVYPLRDPSPDQETRWATDLRPAGQSMFMIAQVLVFLETGRFVYEQAKVADAYAQAVGGSWAEFVQAVSAARLGKAPLSARRKAFARLRPRFTGFENYLLEQLAAKGVYVSKDVVMGEG
jgi:hypothetical protein